MHLLTPLAKRGDKKNEKIMLKQEPSVVRKYCSENATSSVNMSNIVVSNRTKNQLVKINIKKNKNFMTRKF